MPLAQVTVVASEGEGGTGPHVKVSNLTVDERRKVVVQYEQLPQSTPCGATTGIIEGDGSVLITFEEFTGSGMMAGFISGGLLYHCGISEESGRRAPNTQF